eukprot:PhM_4_TR15260/c0_g2_i1/m.19115
MYRPTPPSSASTNQNKSTEKEKERDNNNTSTFVVHSPYLAPQNRSREVREAKFLSELEHYATALTQAFSIPVASRSSPAPPSPRPYGGGGNHNNNKIASWATESDDVVRVLHQIEKDARLAAYTEEYKTLEFESNKHTTSNNNNRIVVGGDDGHDNTLGARDYAPALVVRLRRHSGMGMNPMTFQPALDKAAEVRASQQKYRDDATNPMRVGHLDLGSMKSISRELDGNVGSFQRITPRTAQSVTPRSVWSQSLMTTHTYSSSSNTCHGANPKTPRHPPPPPKRLQIDSKFSSFTPREHVPARSTPRLAQGRLRPLREKQEAEKFM